VVVVQYPRQQGAGFHEIIDVLRMTMYKFKDNGGKPEKLPIPDDERAKADEMHKELVEAVASNDESLMEKYFDKGRTG
jgi:elongation factor G